MSPSTDSRKSILIVDDEEIILLALKESLADKNYNIITTNNPIKAIDYLHQETFAVIISDQRMGEMNGLEFFKKCMEIQPNASRVLITGVLTLKTIIDSVNKGEIYRFVAKPWIREELMVAIDNAVQRFDLINENQQLYKQAISLNDQLTHANQELENRLNQISQAKEALKVAHKAMNHNFNHSLNLCYRIICAFDPLLGAQTMAAVNIVKLINSTNHFSPEEQKLLTTAAWLQKIGLIRIRREIITKANRKPSDLTKEERDELRKHPIYAQGLVTFVDDLSALSTILRSPYERWDGTGYPDGLVGSNIHPLAAMLAVIAYYIESDLNSDQAIEFIANKRGTYFSPQAVDIFMEIARLYTLPRKPKELYSHELKQGMILAQSIYDLPTSESFNEGHAIDEKLISLIKARAKHTPESTPILVYI